MIKQAYPTTSELENQLVIDIVQILKKAINQNGSATLLLSGGSTPIHLYQKLSEKDLLWENVKIGLVDERYVPLESEFSNEKMIREILLQNKATQAQIFGMVLNTQDSEANLVEVNENYHKHLHHIDLCLLGMGGDGHTASLFPGDAASSASLNAQIQNETKIIYTKAPTHPMHRITGSYTYLMGSENLFLMLTGSAKKDLIFNENRELLPIDFFKENLTIYYEK